MTSSKTYTHNHSLVVAVKKHLEKAIANHSFNHALKHRMNQAQHVTYPRIINLIQTPTSLEEIYQAVLKDTYLDCQPCEHDILSLIQMLAQLGLIDVRLEIKHA